jgi:hypothetical protein
MLPSYVKAQSLTLVGLTPEPSTEHHMELEAVETCRRSYAAIGTIHGQGRWVLRLCTVPRK